ncbi:MAG TPA: response regulator transcription factor [Sedimenticola sp.]|nr:response regulator transcription factor [Sedimenticola sp.]
MGVRVLIVDDEPLAREELLELLAELDPSLECQLAADGKAALARDREQPHAVVFLDIGMPGHDGVWVAERLMLRQPPPVLVFTTAHREHALRGFELNAVDYLLKPFGPARLAQALEKVKKALSPVAVQPAAGNAGDNRLWAEQGNGNRILVDADRLLWAEARDKRVFLHTTGGELLRARVTLSQLEAHLPADRFLRVHRAYLVNLDRVREIIPWDSHSMTLVMDDAAASEIPVGRNYAARLKGFVGW